MRQNSQAIIDENTCELCKRLHGTNVPPPHLGCESPNGCRCVLVEEEVNDGGPTP